MYMKVELMLDLKVMKELGSAWLRPGEVTKNDAYPLSQIGRIWSILSRLPRENFITSLDLKDVYWQISLDPAVRYKTAIIQTFECAANHDHAYELSSVCRPE